MDETAVMEHKSAKEKILVGQRRLQGQIAIVTGASRRMGIGAAICNSLAAEGADIFFTHFCSYDIKQDYGGDLEFPHQLTEELRRHGVQVEAMELDLAHRDAPSRLMAEVKSRLGEASILVNNATYCETVGYRELTPQILDAHCAVNITGTFMLSAEFAREIEVNGTGGRIINLVSGQDKLPQPGNLAYVATKGAVSAFTRSLAVELAPLGITVNAVDPGPTDSGWMTPELKDYLLPKFPMGRIGQPADAARLIAFLASDDAGWITGQIIHSDGGVWV